MYKLLFLSIAIPFGPEAPFMVAKPVTIAEGVILFIMPLLELTVKILLLVSITKPCSWFVTPVFAQD